MQSLHPAPAQPAYLVRCAAEAAWATCASWGVPTHAAMQALPLRACTTVLGGRSPDKGQLRSSIWALLSVQGQEHRPAAPRACAPGDRQMQSTIALQAARRRTTALRRRPQAPQVRVLLMHK